MKYRSLSYTLRFIGITATALVFAASTVVSSAQDGWQRITEQGAGFSISFPGRPSYEESLIPETGQPLESYSFYYNGNLLHIVFGPIVPAPRTAMEVNELLGRIAEGYARDTGTLLSHEKLPNRGRQFDNLVRMRNGTLHLRSRVYVRRGMTYTLSCGSYATEGIDERVAGQFFSSFSFTNDVPKRIENARRNSHKKSLPEGAPINPWYKLQGPDGDFVAEFPGKADYSIDTSSSTGAPLHQYRFFYGENFFSVSYRERSEPRATPQQELKQALKSYQAAIPGWELLRQVDMPDGYLIDHRGMSAGYPVLERTRLYLHGTRLYFVSCMTKNLSGPNKDDVNRFFASFRFL